MDADLSTVISEADRILRVKEPEYLAHMELQSTYEDDLDARALRYNVLAYCKYRLPVVSVVFLLRKEADGPAMSGRLSYEVSGFPDASLRFQFRVVRVWEMDPEEILSGPLALLPLAPLTDVSANELPSVVKRMEERIDAEAPPKNVGMLWTTTRLLLGLKYKRGFVRELLKGARGMKESDTYLEILEEGEERGIAKGRKEGRAEEARSILLLLGTKRFGQPDTQTQASLNAITSLERLEQLIERAVEVESWQELLQ